MLRAPKKVSQKDENNSSNSFKNAPYITPTFSVTKWIVKLQWNLDLTNLYVFNEVLGITNYFPGPNNS